MADLRESLNRHLAKAGVAPFLFVGAGISIRYLGLDGWAGLLRRMAELTDFDYEYYVASADGDLAKIASLIADELHPKWWREAKFKDHRGRFKGQLHHSDSALKAEASLYLADSIKRLPTQGALAEEIDLLRGAIVDGVITTNFDPLLENVFPDFKVFVGQEKLLFGDVFGVGEIYKIHGSHEEPDSLVLTSADYERFHERNPYLAAKLMTIFVEHPIVFLGYSLSDPNVGAILHSIMDCLDSEESIARLADRLIFIQWDANATEPELAKTVIKVDEKPIPVMTATVSDFRGVYEALGALQRGFPAKLLRQLKEQVYDLVLEDNPKGRMHVAELGKDGDDLSGIDVVFGVGAIAALRSYTGLGRDEIVEDVLNEETGLIPARVVQEALPEILSHPGNVPMFKYLRDAGLLDPDGDLLEADVPKKVSNRVKARAKKLGVLDQYKAQAQKAIGEVKTLRGLIQTLEPHLVLQYVPALREEMIDPEDLRRFLIKTEELFLREPPDSQWLKMVCFYDWLRYGRQNKSKARRGPRPRLKGTRKLAA
jgi:SIR2-like domain